MKFDKPTGTIVCKDCKRFATRTSRTQIRCPDCAKNARSANSIKHNKLVRDRRNAQKSRA